MKKTATHFKIAAWSIKNPKVTYMVVGGLLISFLGIGIGTALMVNSKTNQSSLFTKKGVNNKDDFFQRADWTMLNQWERDGVQCRDYIKNSNRTRLTSCYTKIGDKWVFKESY